MESNIRNKFLHLQKGVKRQRILLDETTELVEQNEPNNNNETAVVVDENNHPVETEDANEPELVEFECGTTNKSSTCYWHGGFRYLKKYGVHLKCSNSDCPATAKIKTNQDEPTRKLAEEKRKQGKNKILERRGKRTRKVMEEIQDDAELETIQAMGNQRTIIKMLHRERKKKYGNVDCGNPLAIRIPDALLFYQGQLICVYDSRDHRQDPEVVMVFSHPRLIEILKRKKSWGVDGTFRTAPKPWMRAEK